MKRVLSLLDAAQRLCGSDAEMARRLGVPHSHPGQWRNGSRRMTPTTVGLLADLVGLAPDDATRVTLLAVVEGVKDPEKQGILRRLYFNTVGMLRRRASDLKDSDSQPGARH